jgi:CheY-like chemotaxis protein
VLPISHVRNEGREASAERVPTFDSLDQVELPRLEAIRVLVVDDEQDGRALVARILDGQGANPVCASSATEALDLLSREHFDLLLSDIGMPDINGYDFIGQVRQLDKSRSRPLPAIALTAYARTEDRQRSLLAGFHMHLAKPIEARELIASIAGLLHLSQ